MSGAVLKILVIDESAERAEVLLAGLQDAGYHQVHHLREMTDLVPRIAAIDPDVILIDLENPNRDTVEQMFRVSREVKRPIAMFVDESDPEMTKQAIRAGVSAYIIDGLRRDRIQPVGDGRRTAIGRTQGHRPGQGRAHGKTRHDRTRRL